MEEGLLQYRKRGKTRPATARDPVSKFNGGRKSPRERTGSVIGKGEIGVHNTREPKWERETRGRSVGIAGNQGGNHTFELTPRGKMNLLLKVQSLSVWGKGPKENLPPARRDYLKQQKRH